MTNAHSLRQGFSLGSGFTGSPPHCSAIAFAIPVRVLDRSFHLVRAWGSPVNPRNTAIHDVRGL